MPIYGFKDKSVAERLKQVALASRAHVGDTSTIGLLKPRIPTSRTWIGYVENLPAAQWQFPSSDEEDDDSGGASPGDEPPVAERTAIDDFIDDLLGLHDCTKRPKIKPGKAKAQLFQLKNVSENPAPVTSDDLDQALTDPSSTIQTKRVEPRLAHDGEDAPTVEVDVYNPTLTAFKKSFIWIDEDIFGVRWARQLDRPVPVVILDERIQCGQMGQAQVYGTQITLCICNAYCGKLYAGDEVLAHPVPTTCDTSWSVFNANRVLLMKCSANEDQCCESGEVQVTQPIALNCSCSTLDVETVYNPGHSFQSGDTLHCVWNDHSERYEVLASKGTPVKVLTLVDTLEDSGSGDPCVGADTGLKIKSQTICVPVCGSGGDGGSGSGDDEGGGDREITLEFKRIPIQYVRMSDNSEGGGGDSGDEENCKLECAVQEHIILTRSQDDEDCQEEEGSGSGSESGSGDPPTCEELLPDDLEWQTLFQYSWVYGALIDVYLTGDGISGLAVDIAVPCQNGPYEVDLIPTTECPEGSGSA